MLRKGFTLIELLVVIAIIALLIALLLPAIKRARATARVVMCQSRQRQIAVVYLTYESDNGSYPEHGGWPNSLYTLGRFDLRPVLAPYGAAGIYYCPDGGFQTGPNYEIFIHEPGDLMGWHNPYLNASSAATICLFPGFGPASPGGWGGPFDSPPFTDELRNGDRLLSHEDVVVESEAPLASDLVFWEGSGVVSMKNHAFSSGYVTGSPTPEPFNGQNTVFFDGHAAWRDGETVTDMMFAEARFTIWRWSY